MKIVGCAVAGAIGLGFVGFVLGARVPDERAGEIAVMLARGGAVVGAVLGAVAGALLG